MADWVLARRHGPPATEKAKRPGLFEALFAKGVCGMHHFELRFRRAADNQLQIVSFDSEAIDAAIRLLPRDQSVVARGELWCDGVRLFELERACGDFGMLWVISGDSPDDDP